jgi:ankyrin repeat protein
MAKRRKKMRQQQMKEVKRGKRKERQQQIKEGKNGKRKERDENALSEKKRREERQKERQEAKKGKKRQRKEVRRKEHWELDELLGLLNNNKNGNALLQAAASLGEVGECARLLEEGVEVDVITSDDGRTPLHVAASEGHHRVCLLLLENGAEASTTDGQKTTPLHDAAVGGHLKVCTVLIEAGVEIDAMDEPGCTPLILAARQGYTDVCTVLLEAGAELGAFDDQQCTPLHGAAQRSHAYTCTLLLEAGADVDAEAYQQFTSLHFAAHAGSLRICSMLLHHGAKVNAQTDKQHTPLHYAASVGHPAVCYALIQAGAVVDARADALQVTPLHLAAKNGQDVVCKTLLAAGANISARTTNDRTPADYASKLDRSLEHAALAKHLRSSNGVHYLRCTGPSLERELVWNDASQAEEAVVLDRMQTKWMEHVVEGCEHAQVVLAMSGIHSGRLSTEVLMNIAGFVFSGTQAYLLSCFSTRRVPATLPAALCRQRFRQEGALAQESLSFSLPRLGVVSHMLARRVGAIAAAATTFDEHGAIVLQVGAGLEVTMARLVAEAGGGNENETDAQPGCVWLQGYCSFVQLRYAPRSSNTPPLRGTIDS